MKILELKVTISKKNLLAGFNSKIERTGKKISELKKSSAI